MSGMFHYYGRQRHELLLLSRKWPPSQTALLYVSKGADLNYLLLRSVMYLALLRFLCRATHAGDGRIKIKLGERKKFIKSRERGAVNLSCV